MFEIKLFGMQKKAHFIPDGYVSVTIISQSNELYAARRFTFKYHLSVIFEYLATNQTQNAFYSYKNGIEYPIYVENRLQMMNSLDVSPVQNESAVLNDYYMV